MTVGSLFAGIGGFDLGFERAGFKIKWQVEIDPFCRAVLEKHWPDVRRYEDVRTVGAELERVDVLCGGFPCQDISYVGAGAGLDGARSGLWFEMRRLICELRPRYVVVENVAALLDRGLRRVCGDLADCGYDAEWCCFPTGRPMGHNRERLFLVAYPVCARLSQRGDADTDGADETRIFTRERFASLLAGVDPRQKWADRPLLGRGLHGIPRRVDRVKALGNSIVPEVTERIAEQIKAYEERILA